MKSIRKTLCMALVLVMAFSGAAMAGRFGLDELISLDVANTLHLSDLLLSALVATLIVHGGLCIYPKIRVRR